ncbi:MULTISPECIES: tetratricopeptide repeat protein [Rhodanobacter]|uniref:tetratricopeptide repeat protein n=1 Tax=Rhodanobacter TaxID=75309 RepID=UPI000918ED27|nr:tetratricopeptide repeat protein [Rhodanobacter thiooxydans]TAN18110.1 MAG: tetratricopeptide repeat protein [Rhodanobacter sp.]UJJ56516.1 tetratricopeptide repeat protein [Rhodanobacter thiooxydans]
MHSRIAANSTIAVLSLLILTGLAYWHGLFGDFLFDDFTNLPALGASGPIDNWPAFWRYITSGTADPTGRPLTLLTFLLDAHDWPADPFPFKRGNLILHLLNGVLLYALLARLGRLLRHDDRRRRTAALLGTTLWLLHPLLVSTTLYIVQREAMLPATYTLAGLLLWLHGRQLLAQGRTAVGLGWSVLGLGGFTVLGVLAKANGALLPLFALLIEEIVLAPRHPVPDNKPRLAHRFALFAFGVVPAVAILGYLLRTGLLGVLDGGPVGFRPWSVGQRLLTEPRVLLDYLQLLWLPRPFSSGLFNDQYVASISWLQPITTLPAMLAVFGLIGLAWWQRRRYPALALAILFYFAGQLLESTSIPLELYFEHRNYLPALLMFWPLGLWLANARKLRLLKYTLMLALPLGLAWITHTRAELWGNVHSQALLWATINPNSARAQTNAAQIEMRAGQPQAAVRRLEKLLVDQPNQVQLAFNLIGARCMIGGITADDLDAAKLAMQGTPNTGTLFANWFERTLPAAMSGGCPGLTAQGLQQLIDTGLDNPKLSAAGPQQDLTYLRGKIALAQGRPDEALADFTRALNLQVRPGMALEAAATLGRAGYPSHGLRLLDHYETVRGNAMKPGFGMPWLHAWVLEHQHYWPHELDHLRRQLALDARADSMNTSGHTSPAGTSD